MPTWTVLELLRRNPEIYKEHLEKRGIDTQIADRAIEVDIKWREELKRVNEIRRKLNEATMKIAKASTSEEKRGYLRTAKKLKEKLSDREKILREYELKRKKVLFELPNIVADDVPEGLDESFNVPIRYWGKPKVWGGYEKQFKEQTEKFGFKIEYELIDWKPKGHAEMVELVLKKGDTLQAAKIAGSRFYYLFNDLVWLDFAISLYAQDLMTRKGYKLVLPPYMVRRDVMEAALDLESFEDMIYKIEGEDLYLIGTAEHPLLALYKGKVIQKNELPIKLVGWSACFRKEAGAHGKDTKGIFRVHQFHKVEQFIFCHPEDSWKFHEELLKNAEEICRGLELPYRVVNMCAGELGYHAAKKYDVEAWFPAQGKYREIISCSNCLDWQAFRANIVYAEPDGKREYVHTLNSTAIPTSRTICCILENFQEPDGSVIIPKVLRKYLEVFPKAPKDKIHPFEVNKNQGI